MKKLIAIDGNSLMHRAFYALPPMNTRSGLPTGAVHGFLGMLLKLIAESPDYLLVAFDMHGPTFRHQLYDQYKAGRRETPDELRPQFDTLKNVLAEMGIAICECPRYEADDILGTFSRIANGEGVFALLVTGDRDALQLIGENTHVMLTKKGISETDEYDRTLLLERYGLTPDRMVDLKGLMGDGSDNIPGVPGVGEKTALKLLEEYKSMEAVLENAARVKGKLGEKLAQYADQARMSLELGRIDVNVPVTMTLEDCAFYPERMRGALPLLQELEMRSLGARVAERSPAPKSAPAPVAAAISTRVSTDGELERLAKRAKDAQWLAIDIQNGLCVALDGKEQFSVVCEATLLEQGLEPDAVLEALAPALEAEKPQKLVFDAKQLMHLLARNGIRLGGLRFDAMIAEYLLNPTRPAATFRELCRARFGEGEPSAARLFALMEQMEREMREQSLNELYATIEQPLIEVLFDMEREGFMLDIAMLHSLSKRFDERIGELAYRIYEAAGKEFNILSTRQLGEVLFETLGLPAQKKTRTGYSTDAEVLEKLEGLHPVVPMVQEYRFLTKLKSTFADGLLVLARAGTGRIHTTFHQNVAATGRISSAEPNLQNIPVRTELGREIRRAFIASEGNLLVGADYSQIELRLLAHMSGDEGMLEAFNSGGDIHTRTAAEVFSVPLDKVTSAQRGAAKAVNFGIIYGISDFGLGRNLGISRREAGEYIKRYFERYPRVHEYMRLSVEEGKRLGYAVTLFGRRRELSELKSPNFNTRSFGERVAMNMPLQGTAADIIKLAMVRVHDQLEKEGLRAKLVLQIHDELIVDAPVGEAERVREILLEQMQNVIALKVPLTAQASIAHSWYDMK
ncbi:MAG: DNA polymerase I [Bacillota bacterium]